MKLARYRGADGPRLGVLDDAGLRELPEGLRTLSVEAVLRARATLLAEIGQAATQASPTALDMSTLLPPLETPSKIICVGQNYAAHAAESGVDKPREPVIFSKFPSALIGAADAILLPSPAPGRVDYEAELAVVIGRRGRDVQAADAMDYVGGYAVANDVSARDWQLKKPAGQWLLGKSFDTFLPLGPALVTADEIEDPAALRVTCRVGGETLQDDLVGNMIFDIPTLIAYVSQVATLEPGDLLLTGTPAGVGQSRQPPRWLQAGDVVETEIAGLGLLRNVVVAA